MNYDTMTLAELETAAKRADAEVKRRNAILATQTMSIWTDPEYMRLLAIADDLDAEVAGRKKEEKDNVG